MKKFDLIGNHSSNQLNKEFEVHYHSVIQNFFSRNPKLWPVFSDPIIHAITKFRKTTIADADLVKHYPNGPELFSTLNSDTTIQKDIRLPDHGADPILACISALCKNWENPLAVENVVAMPSDPAIYGSILGLIGNPNMVYCEYSGGADDLEKNVIKKVANLIGYDANQASGLFTQGGTMCNLYGYLFGIRKSLSQSKHLGMSVDQDYRIINSQGGHYSNMTNLSLLGVDIKNKTIRIRVNDDNTMDQDDLETQMRACFTVHCKVPVILLTAGTTDTFGVDAIEAVYHLRNRLCEEYAVEHKPHIHVDAAVGWPILFFLDYDFKSNPLAINEAALSGLRLNVEKFGQLKYADSITIDFHKRGYVPYTSSLVMVKDGNDFKYLENDPENFTYFEHDLEGQTHLQSTIECSRSGAGIFGAYSALHYLGIEGYQTIIAHCLQNANYLRNQLFDLGNACVMVPGNQGPSVGFKLYDPKKYQNPEEIFNYELSCANDKEALKIMRENSHWHRNIFSQRGKNGLFTNWVDSIACSTYAERDKYIYIPGEKAVFMNPTTERVHIDQFMTILRNMMFN